MEELVQTFQVDWRILLAQCVNFALVVGVLGFFAFKPLIKLMTQRSQQIEQGVSDAAIAKERLADAEKEKEKQIIVGRQTAQKILETAEKDAVAIQQEKLSKTQEEIKQVVAEAKNKISNEKEKMVSDAKKDLAEVVSVSLKKVLGKALTNEKLQQSLVNEALVELEKADWR